MLILAFFVQLGFSQTLVDLPQKWSTPCLVLAESQEGYRLRFRVDKKKQQVLTVVRYRNPYCSGRSQSSSGYLKTLSVEPSDHYLVGFFPHQRRSTVFDPALPLARYKLKYKVNGKVVSVHVMEMECATGEVYKYKKEDPYWYDFVRAQAN